MYHADQSEEGVRSEICRKLAAYHNIAVDAPKTGKSVPSDSKELINVPRWPDFMQRPASQSYPSTKILGKLYRACDPSLVTYQDAERAFVALDENLALEDDGSERISVAFQAARELRDEFVETFDRALKRFLVADEQVFEAISGSDALLAVQCDDARSNSIDAPFLHAQKLDYGIGRIPGRTGKA
jgi:hypothetical protein